MHGNYILFLAAVSMLVLLTSLTDASADLKVGTTNLLQNSGFEEGSKGWTIDEGIMQIDQTVFRSGKNSLKLSWDDPGKRKLATHEIPAKPGKRYLISAWMKSKNVHGALKGACFGVEWHGKDGFIGGSAPMGIGWDTEWTEIRYLSAVVPKNATRAEIYATLDWSGVGEAWIDDITVYEVDAPEVYSWKVANDTVVGADDSEAFQITLENIALEVLGEELDLSVSLCSPPWNSVMTEQKVALQNTTTVSIPTDKLYEGNYKLKLAIKSRKSGKTLMLEEYKPACKRPPMQCLTVPHSGIVVPGSKYPSLSIKPYRNGTLSGEVVSSDGTQLALISPKSIAAGKAAHITIPGRPDPGRYHVHLKLTSTGKPDYISSVPFTVLTSEEVSRGTLIGPDNLLYDRGKVWFPMFVYAHTAWDPKAKKEMEKRDAKDAEDLLDHLQGTPFGVLDYATPIGGLDDTVAFADECQKRGIRLALSVKDVYPDWGGFKVREPGFPGMTPEQIVRKLAERMKNHPAMALYYTNDELSTQFYGPMMERRRLLHEIDPLHPTLHVHYDLDCIPELAPTYDIFGPELYPWAWEDLVLMGKWSDTVTKKLPEGSPFWGCLWLFQNEPERLKALTYLAIAKGARGLLYYSYYDFKPGENFEGRWKSFVELGREVESNMVVLLQPEKKGFCKTKASGIILRTVSGDKGTYLLAVNANKKHVKAEITTGGNITRAEENGVRHWMNGGLLKLDFAPFQVRLIRLTGDRRD